MRDSDVKKRRGHGAELPPTPWALSPGEIAERLRVDPEEGLDSQRVRQNAQEFGANRLQEKKKVGAWKILADQFKDLIIILLAVASLAAFLFGERLEGFAVAVALLINGAIGFFTELKATRSMEALHRLGETRTRVRREGRSVEISAADLVPGDIVLIDAGDLVPADLRLLEANNLQADESALTGESVPTAKGIDPLPEDAPLAERSSMLFRGTAVTTGSGLGIVTATGMATELGNVADLAQQAEEEQTPLERRLERLGYRLIALTFVMGVIVAVAGLIGGRDMALVVKTAIAMAIAAVPEGLPVVATIALARGMWRMAQRNALITRLSAVETLGATTIIFTDKTGTLTENRMTVRRFALPLGDVDLAEGDFRRGGEKLEPPELLRRALRAGVLCNNAAVDEGGRAATPWRRPCCGPARRPGWNGSLSWLSFLRSGKKPSAPTPE